MHTTSRDDAYQPNEKVDENQLQFFSAVSAPIFLNKQNPTVGHFFEKICQKLVLPVSLGVLKTLKQ